jgi:hypothetical protein
VATVTVSDGGRRQSFNDTRQRPTTDIPRRIIINFESTISALSLNAVGTQCEPDIAAKLPSLEKIREQLPNSDYFGNMYKYFTTGVLPADDKQIRLTGAKYDLTRDLKSTWESQMTDVVASRCKYD